MRGSDRILQCKNSGIIVWEPLFIGDCMPFLGGEWNGKMYGGAAEWLKSWAKVPADEWLKLMDQWNPAKFDAKKWARMAKEMGAKYVKITTKHHEGFCLWPSKYTNIR